MDAVIASTFSSALASGINATAAAIPSATLLVGMTKTGFSARSRACSADKMIFLLFGRMNTVFALTSFIVDNMS